MCLNLESVLIHLILNTFISKHLHNVIHSTEWVMFLKTWEIITNDCFKERKFTNSFYLYSHNNSFAQHY